MGSGSKGIGGSVPSPSRFHPLYPFVECPIARRFTALASNLGDEHAWTRMVASGALDDHGGSSERVDWYALHVFEIPVSILYTIYIRAISPNRSCEDQSGLSGPNGGIDVPCSRERTTFLFGAWCRRSFGRRVEPWKCRGSGVSRGHQMCGVGKDGRRRQSCAQWRRERAGGEVDGPSRDIQ
jgi:hypothetical protein